MRGHFGYLHFKTLKYDPGIMSVMPMAVGCLTMKNTQECMAVFSRCLAVFVDFFHFLLLLLLFLLFISFLSYFIMLKGVRFVTFFTICNFHKLLFIVEKGQGLYSIHCAMRDRVHYDFFSFFYC